MIDEQVMIAEDRSMCEYSRINSVRTAWIDIDLCRLGFRMRMSPEAVKRNLGGCLTSASAHRGRLLSGIGRAGGFSLMTADTTTSRR